MRTRLLQRVPAIVGVFLLVVLLTAWQRPAWAGHEPADKTAAAGSNMVQFGPGAAVTLLSENLRSSTPSDLILEVTLECSILINTLDIGMFDSSTVQAQVRVWVEVDGVAVPVSSLADGTPNDNGRIVFCDRVRNRTNIDIQILRSEFDQTRSANGFNWMRLNLGNGIHTIDVKADLIQFAASTDFAAAQAVVARRTLIIEPVKLTTHQDVQPATP